MGMSTRSTNAIGFVHFGGDLVAGVNDGVGILLHPASTGSTAVIEPISDSDTAGLKIRAKGAATLTLGNSSNSVLLVGPKPGTGSTSAVTLMQRYLVSFTAPELAASTAMDSTHACVGLTTGASLIMVTPRSPISNAYTFTPRCTAANLLTVAIGNTFGSTIGSGETTNAWIVVQIT